MAAALLLSAAPIAASAEELIVYHGWSSKAEVAALNILQGALNEKGHTWKDLAIPHNSGVNVSIVNMVTGGDPPNAFVTSDPHIFRDLAGLGLERDLTDYYKEIGAADNFFPIVRELSTVDGKMVKVPLFLHIDGMVYWNMEVAKAAGVDPTAWKSVDEMIADFPKIKAAMLAEYRRLVGEVPDDGRPLRPRTELVLSTEKYRAYRVLLDVTEGVEVYGNLLVPERLQGRAAAVVCQHGLSGTPEMITGLGQTKDTPYHEFGRRLAERGYVVFAPMILHRHPVEWTNDQARMADAAGMMRVALAAAKTRRVVDFLAGLPFVDPRRIGYYGLSYGGYSAIWISPLEERLAAVVVSGHFNDWRSKITADSTPTSYLLHPDEDFYNWDVLNRFSHVEILSTVAPRAVCIEYGTRDGITTPEWTAYAWRQLAAIRDHLGLEDRIVLAQFEGVHEARCEGSFAFLDRVLRERR